jgi:membrane associated rhomboid family serine protease
MAANDYYNSVSSPRPYYNDDRYDSHVSEPSLAASPSNPPSYASQTRPPQPHSPSDRPGAASSPFETAFDDHVYPMDARQGSQGTFVQDTRYHGVPHQGNVSPLGPDDIPLQNQNNKPYAAGTAIGAMSSNDHVHDTAERGGTRGASRRGRLRFGELGMLGSGNQKIPIFVYLFTAVQVAVFIGELVKAANLTGSAIQTSPSFNPMIGPSQQVLINMGGRYEPCMHNTRGIQDRTSDAVPFPCPWSTTNDPLDPANRCTLSEVCGFGGVPEPLYTNPPGLAQNPFPNQWFRFIVPIFMHSGVVHIAFNLLVQLMIGKEIERSIGSIRFFLVYMSAGIFGNVMGANFAGSAVVSTGASGSLFGIIAILLLDLIYSWGERRNPMRELIFVILQILVCFALGLLPGLDNFCHIGGFLVGLCVGISVLHSPNALRQRIGEDHFRPAYSNLGGRQQGISSVAFPAFYRNPVGFFKGRKALWWAWWIIRVAFLIFIIVIFFVLLNSFYANTSNCPWCKYLSCLPVNGWCDNNIVVTYTPVRRGLAMN